MPDELLRDLHLFFYEHQYDEKFEHFRCADMEYGNVIYIEK